MDTLENIESPCLFCFFLLFSVFPCKTLPSNPLAFLLKSNKGWTNDLTFIQCRLMVDCCCSRLVSFYALQQLDLLPELGSVGEI